MFEALPQLAFTLAPLTIGALIALFAPLKLKTFQGVYLALGSLWIAFHMYFIPEVPIWELALILLLGEVAQFLIVGLLGSRMGPANYASIMIGVGLFPWYLGLGTSFIYFMLFCLIAVIWSKVRGSIASKRFEVKGKIEKVEAELSKGEFEKYLRMSVTILSGPLLIAALSSVLLTSL